MEEENVTCAIGRLRSNSTITHTYGGLSEGTG